MPKSYEAVFHNTPVSSAIAHGRVNLLGGHTDYNNGFVLPTLIPQATQVKIGRSSDAIHRVYSTAFDQVLDCASLHPPFSDFGCYVWGICHLLQERGIALPFLNIWIDSSIPVGRGLSSSAALEIAVLRSLRSMLDLPHSDLELAKLAQTVEHHYAGVRCGIMDSMAISMAQPRHLLFLDTLTLDYELIPMPAADLVVLDSGVPRQLAQSEYNQRRHECEQAAHQLGISSLRDLHSLDQLRSLPPLLQQRATHVFTENQRVLQAYQTDSVQELGALMNQSHQSLRDHYQVSVPELDQLVDRLQALPTVFGARLTGAGFGGTCVALVQPKQAATVAEQVLSQYSYSGQCLVPTNLIS